MDDALMRDFFDYGLGPGIPPKTGYFLAQLCERRGATSGTHVPEPVRFAELIGIRDWETGTVRADDLAAIIAFLGRHNFLMIGPDGSLTLAERGVTWWQQHDRPITQEMLHDMLLTAGLGRVTDVIERHARPSIRLTAHAVENEDALPVGASKLGGSPDLPPDFDWPMQGGYALAFIAQINLSEASAYDAEHLLPATGMLHFFYGYFNYYTLGASLQTVNAVRYVDDEISRLRRTLMPSPFPKYGGPYRPCSFSFQREITPLHYHYFSRLDASWLRDLQEHSGAVEAFTEKERAAYDEVITRLQGPAYNINRILGHPDPIQDLHLLSDEVLLLQVDSEDDLADMMWGDVGRLFWWMQKDALACRDFGSVKFDEQCS